MSEQWYIKTKNGKRGPYSKAQLQRYIDAGAIRPNAGLGDGEGAWVAAATIAGLSFSEEALNQLRAAKQAAQASQSAISNAQTAVSSAQPNHLQEAKAQVELREAEINRRQSELVNREAELSEREAAVATREAHLQESENTLASQRATLEAALLDLENQRGELEQLDNDSANRAEQVEAELAGLKEKLADAQTELSQIRQLHEEQLQTIQTELEQTRTEAEASAEQVTSLQSEIESQKELFESRESELNDREESLNQRERDLQSRDSELDEREKEFRQREEAIVRQTDDMEARATELRQTEQSIEDEQRRLAEQKSEVESRHAEVLSLQRELETSANALTDAPPQMTDEAESLRDRVDELETSLETSQRELEQLRAADRNSRENEAAAAANDASTDDHSTVDLLAQKKKLLADFAARQESLSCREADLIRREDELLKRELDIAGRDEPSSPEHSLQIEPETFEEPALEEHVDHDDWDSVSESEADPIDRGDAFESSEPDEPTNDAGADQSTATNDVADVDGPSADPEPFKLGNDLVEATSDVDFAEALENASVSGETAGVAAEPKQETLKANSWEEIFGSGRRDDLVDRDEVLKDVLPSTSPEDKTSRENFLPDSAPYFDDVLGESLQTSTDQAGRPDSEVRGLPPDAETVDPPISTAAVGEVELVQSADAILQFRKQAFEKLFGPPIRYDVDDDPVMRVDISIHAPHEERDFTTLVTSGMSDYPIAMPNGQRSVRAELLLYVTHIDETAIEILRAAAKVPYQRKQGLTIGSTATLNEFRKLMQGSHQQHAVYLLPVIESDSKPIPAKDLLGNSIQLFWLVTITDGERKLIESSGIHKFMSLLERNNHAVYFDLTRDCYVKRKRWFRR